MQKIVPHLWFDKEAVQAAELYVATFPNSKIKHKSILNNTPSGSVDIVTFELAGLDFQAISAGPEFKFNPSVSFYVSCSTRAEVDRIWEQLLSGGQALMELGEYPFSEHYGWLQDRYGLSWQIIYTPAPAKQMIKPVVMFANEVYGKAEEAVRFWTSTFPSSSVGALQHYGPGQEPDKEGSLMYGSFTLSGVEFGAMDSGYPHQFAFNEAVSFIVQCETQEEIDRYWSKLSAVPAAEQCGWLKDKYGVSWQVVPAGMQDFLGGTDRDRVDRVTQAFLVMKKIDMAGLQKAYEGR